MKRAFTLIELIVALAGGVLILAAILQLFSQARQTLDQGGRRAEAVQNGRIALEEISRDLRQAEVMVSSLPETDTDPQRPPPSELEFQDGHDAQTLTYIRYYLLNGTLNRELSYYSFPADPDVRVTFDRIDEFGDPPDRTVLEDEIVAEQFLSLEFWGENPISIRAALGQETHPVSILTTLFGRNLPGS